MDPIRRRDSVEMNFHDAVPGIFPTIFSSAGESGCLRRAPFPEWCSRCRSAHRRRGCLTSVRISSIWSAFIPMMLPMVPNIFISAAQAILLGDLRHSFSEFHILVNHRAISGQGTGREAGMKGDGSYAQIKSQLYAFQILFYAFFPNARILGGYIKVPVMGVQGYGLQPGENFAHFPFHRGIDVPDPRTRRGQKRHSHGALKIGRERVQSP